MEYIVVVNCWGDGENVESTGRRVYSIRCHTRKAAETIAAWLNTSEGIAGATVVED